MLLSFLIPLVPPFSKGEAHIFNLIKTCDTKELTLNLLTLGPIRSTQCRDLVSFTAMVDDLLCTGNSTFMFE